MYERPLSGHASTWKWFGGRLTNTHPVHTKQVGDTEVRRDSFCHTQQEGAEAADKRNL